MMKRTLRRLATTAVLAWAASTAARAEDDPIFELAVTHYGGSGAGDSLLTTQIYAEKALPVRDVSAFLALYQDKEFRSAYAGLARKFGDLQIGLGVGNAWYDQIRHPTINPWLYYATDDADIYLTAERYSRESTAPWFYKGYATWRIADSISIGAYGEKDLGAGPMIRWRSGSFRIWAAVPVVSQPEAGARGVAGIQIEF